MGDHAYYAEIDRVEFYMLDSVENYIDSQATVTNPQLFRQDLPIFEGVYDPGMGTTDHSWLCRTCGNKKGVCPGHSGSIDVKYPVKSPLFREHIVKWLKIICFKCGRIIVNKTVRASKKRLLTEYGKFSRNIDKCPYSDCGAPHPHVSQDKFEKAVIYAEYKGAAPGQNKQELFNHQIQAILGRITDDTVLKMGKPLISHPKKLILDTIRVAPNTIRPDIRRIGGNRSNNSDITALTKNIVEINTLLPIEIPENNEISKDLREVYFNLDMTYFTLVKGASTAGNQVRMVTSTNKVPNSIANRIPKKEGRVRRSLMGKRTRYMMRSVNINYYYL